ncbi:MAG: putative transporter [Paracidovorax wautersii]|uniref:Putative transporter n=1 Tax=Paracidovorax wautersii TaxID=1177982 RepID=A0A7V8JRH0_9BURK|nr:MAG: putative transporter [Paracidovorax wautersii]
MSSIQPVHATPHAPDLPAALVLLLAVGAGLAVASIYYSQPMLGVLAAEIGASPGAVGWMPTLTQLGYALGILLLAPLGDRYDRRRVILAKAAALVASLAWMAAAPSIHHLLAASLAVGMAATLAQDIVPAAATLAPAQHRGRVIGTVMTGLLMGILLSRTVSGVVSQQFGWRAMFVAAAAVAFLGLVLWRGLPRFAPATRLPYPALLGSLAELWRAHPALRRAALAAWRVWGRAWWSWPSRRWPWRPGSRRQRNWCCWWRAPLVLTWASRPR